MAPLSKKGALFDHKISVVVLCARGNTTRQMGQRQCVQRLACLCISCKTKRQRLLQTVIGGEKEGLAYCDVAMDTDTSLGSLPIQHSPTPLLPLRISLQSPPATFYELAYFANIFLNVSIN